MKSTLHFAGIATVSALCGFVLAASPGCGDDTASNTNTTTAKTCAEDPTAAVCTSCSRASECGDKLKWICTPSKRCQKLCAKTADCSTGEICEDAVCRPPACGSDAQCSNGEVCLGGSCKAPVEASSVASCSVLPGDFALAGGVSAQLSVIARDAAGTTLPFKGAVTWSSTDSDAVAVTGSSITGSVTGGTAAGKATVKATIGSVDCSATVRGLGSLPDGKLRVTVVSSTDHLPVSGAKVVSGTAEATTDENGVALLSASGDKATVSVFHAGYSYVTVVGASTRDLSIPVTKTQTAARYSGTMTPRSFDDLSDPRGNVHLALFGGSIPGNVTDLDLDTLIGKQVNTRVELADQSAELPLPEGIVLGLSETMFRGDYVINATPGTRTLWGLGGNADLSAITRALGPALTGGSSSDINIGGVLAALLPLIGKLQSGVVSGVQAAPSATQSIDLKLNTLLRLKTEARLPAMPSGSAVAGATFEGAIVLGAGVAPGQGIVPLGLTAGVDLEGGTPDSSGNPTGNGRIDPLETGAEEGRVSLRMAPLHSGLETGKYMALALAASFTGLASSDSPTLLSGLVAYPSSVTYGDTATQLAFPGEFLGIPSQAGLTERTFVTAPVSGASFYKLDVGTVSDGQWTVYFDGSTPVEIPAAPAGFDDRLTSNAGGAKRSLLLQSLRLKSTSGGFEGAVGAAGPDLGTLDSDLEAFSVRSVAR